MRGKLFLVAVLFYLLLFCWGRFLLLDKMTLDNSPTIYPVILDFFLAVLIILVALVLKKINSIVSILFIFILTFLHISNMEYIYALDSVINFVDIHYIIDKQFISGTLSHVNFPIYNILILLSSIFIVIITRVESYFKIISRNWILLLSLSFLALSLQFLITPSNSSWKDENSIILSSINSYNTYANKSRKLATLDNVERLKVNSTIFPTNQVVEGELLLPAASFGKKKNVLLVVMEGIPGAYLEEVQQATGFKDNIKLSSLDKIANHSLIVPNFLTHNNQTIRGLYSILSGDYPKLDSSTPKAYEYMQLPKVERLPMLPQILKERGYFTSFFQAAPLEFMSKDQFMDSAGFDEIIGEADLPRRYIPFGWGVDDKAFYEQAAEHIEELNSKEDPWFLTLLNVGTHHPYAVPVELEEKYSSRKEASIAYLDSSLNHFIDFIDQKGISENTLIIFTSDESHGVNNQPIGSNWGTCLVYDPDINKTIINSGVFGQMDILTSIMDYMQPINNMQGRSIFRNYSTERPLLFSSHYEGSVYYSNKKGVYYKLSSNGEMSEIIARSGEMFSANYSVRVFQDQELEDNINKYMDVSNNSLSRIKDGNGEYIIIKDKKYLLKRNNNITVTGGQYINIPANSIVTFRFDYDLRGSKDLKAVSFKLNAQNSNIKTKVINKNVASGELKHQFFAPEEANLSFDLYVASYGGHAEDDELGELDLSNVSVSFIESTDSDREKLFSSFDEYNIPTDGTYNNLIPLMYTNGNIAYPYSGQRIQITPSDSGGVVVYGPYMTLGKGQYKVIYKISPKKTLEGRDHLFTIDTTSNAGSKLLAERSLNAVDIEKENELFIATLPLNIVEEELNVELRLRDVASNLEFLIEEITLIKLSE